jgi:hypothetical protein
MAFQIAMPKGVIQDWGLVEFFDPMDTETTQASRNGYPIRGQPIRVHFCIPGVNAINIYMQVRVLLESQSSVIFPVTWCFLILTPDVLFMDPNIL